MKTQISEKQTKYSLIIIASTIMLVLSNSCATKKPFLNSTVVPAAVGTVKVKEDKNKNYTIKIEISNLADPSRLQPPKKVYVVWMESENNVVKNLGQIVSSSGMSSNNLKASLESLSTVRPTRIFITAEDDPAVQYPASVVVLSTTYL